MGYATVTPYSLFEFSSEVESTVTVGTPIATQDINDIVIPAFRNAPDYVYIDIYVQGRENTHAALNYLKLGSKVGIRDTGATFRSGGNILEQTLLTPGVTRYAMTTILPGTVNIAQYIKPGDTIVAALYAEAENNSIDLFDVFGRVRCYFSII